MSKGTEKYIREAGEAAKKAAETRKIAKSWKFDTIAVHGLYSLEEALTGGHGGIMEPLIASTSQAFRDSDEMEAALSYQIPSWTYSRIHNPTIGYLEDTLALLETYGSDLDASALCTSSGMSAIKQAVEPLVAKMNAGAENINFVSSTQVYGGTYQLFSVRMPERGVEPKWVAEPSDLSAWEKLIDENTRFLYAEMPSNPQLGCVDVEALAKLAHRHEIPLIIDSTIATPALLRPLCHGADIVVQSVTKTIGSGGSAIGGAVIARHHLTSKHLAAEQKENYAGWLKLWPFRDSGPCMTPWSAYLFLSDLRTLRLKMESLSHKTERVVEFLAGHPRVESVAYLGLKSHPLHDLAAKYMKLADTEEPMFGHLCSFVVKGPVADARHFFDRLNIVVRATDLGRIKSVATIPAISTHQQQGEEARKRANIPPNLVRLCVGAEDSTDIINDLKQALEF
jgi:O-acetylhomoserine (thiol)-lyase